MNGIARHPMTFAWAVLIAATLLLCFLAEGAGAGRTAIVAVILIAAFKVRMVFLWFMELRSGAMPWRAVAEGWVVLVAAILVSGYLLTPPAG